MGILGPFEENTIIVGDCLDIMAQMPGGCVDLVVTDPPYNIGKDYGDYNDRLPEDEYWATYKHWMVEIYRVMGPGALYISCLSRQLWDIRPLIEATGFTFAQLLIWHGPNIPRGSHAISMPWNPVSEPILMFWKGPRQRMLNVVHGLNSFDVLKFTRPQRSYGGDLHRIHITQKPLELYKTIIGRTPGDLVADFFMGSGTTAVVADRLGRNFFGCDINKEYVEMALERLEKDRAGRQLQLL